MLFSERYGYKPVRQQLQIESIDEGLKNLLWSAYLEHFLHCTPNLIDNSPLYDFAEDLFTKFFKYPIDDLNPYIHGVRGFFCVVNELTFFPFLRKYFFDNGRIWHEYYDLIELSIPYAPNDFAYWINKTLESEKSAYRIVNDQIVPITSETEISAIEEATDATDKYKSVNTHLNTALKLLSDKQNPDYRNSIKESISSVESICRIFTGNDKATLGMTLSQLEQENKLHPALKKSFSSLYGYTSDSSGIRHALIENDASVDFHEAKFMLVTCSAFVNYLIGMQSNS